MPKPRETPPGQFIGSSEDLASGASPNEPRMGRSGAERMNQPPAAEESDQELMKTYFHVDQRANAVRRARSP